CAIPANRSRGAAPPPRAHAIVSTTIEEAICTHANHPTRASALKKVESEISLRDRACAISCGDGSAAGRGQPASLESANGTPTATAISVTREARPAVVRRRKEVDRITFSCLPARRPGLLGPALDRGRSSS